MPAGFRIYFRSLMYFFAITTITVFATLMLHEMGHAAFGLLSGCRDVRIIAFDNSASYPYTEMACVISNAWHIGLSGYFLIFPFASLFLFLPRVPERLLVIVIMGFNIMISAWDLKTYLSESFFLPVMVSGAGILLIGEILFIEQEGIYIESALGRASHNPSKEEK